MHSVMGPNTKDPQSMLAKECTVPDAQADLSPERSTHQFAESDDLNGRNVSTPSILGIWRVGSSIYASDHCVISLGQPPMRLTTLDGNTQSKHSRPPIISGQ